VRTLGAMSETVVVCRKCKNHECLVQVLEDHADISLRMVRCQKICHGPVVGLPVAGRMEWFERVESLKEIAGLIRVAKKSRSSIPKSLKKRRVKRRAGRKPRD
jgi:hypothetical protein